MRKKTKIKQKAQKKTAAVRHHINWQYSAWWFGAVVAVIGTALTWILIAEAVNPVLGTSSPASATSRDKAASQRPARRLDGTWVESADENRWPIAVMIENLPVVRPQAGLASARVVYETLAEGGATRFMALFDGTESLAKIGPVRSARTYYVNWATGYNAAYVHAGGSPSALIELAARKLLDLNGIGSAAKYFWRDRALAAPHNLFVSTENMNAAISDSGLAAQSPAYDSWAYKEDLSLDQRGQPSAAATIAFSGKAFEVAWEYHRDTNNYLRFNAGVPHRDSLSQQAISAKNVIIEFLPPEKYLGDKGRIGLETTGSGRALVLRDGLVIEGIWKKPTIWRRTAYFDADNKPIQLNRGTTWIEVVPGNRSVKTP